MELSRICVYCGSSAGAGPDFADAARALGELFARSGITLVYGGAAVGPRATASRLNMCRMCRTGPPA